MSLPTICKSHLCGGVEPVFCHKTLKGEGVFTCDVPEWILCITDCEFIHNRKVCCGTEEVFVPGTILVQYVWFDGARCRHGVCKIPADFCFANPCVGVSEKVLECNCGQPKGRCSARIEIERCPETHRRRKARVVVDAEVSLGICCVVDVVCPPVKC